MHACRTYYTPATRSDSGLMESESLEPTPVAKQHARLVSIVVVEDVKVAAKRHDRSVSFGLRNSTYSRRCSFGDACAAAGQPPTEGPVCVRVCPSAPFRQLASQAVLELQEHP